MIDSFNLIIFNGMGLQMRTNISEGSEKRMILARYYKDGSEALIARTNKNFRKSVKHCVSYDVRVAR